MSFYVPLTLCHSHECVAKMSRPMRKSHAWLCGLGASLARRATPAPASEAGRAKAVGLVVESGGDLTVSTIALTFAGVNMAEALRSWIDLFDYAARSSLTPTA